MTWVQVIGSGWDTSAIGLLGVFAAGIMVAVSPSALPLIPVITGYVVGSECRQGWVRLLAFLAGMIFAGMVLGVVFTTASWLIGTLIGPAWNAVIGVALMVLGLRMLRLIRFKGIAIRTKRRQVASPLAAFLFGVPFVFAL